MHDIRLLTNSLLGLIGLRKAFQKHHLALVHKK